MKTTAKLFVLAVLTLALSAGRAMAQNPNAEKGKTNKEEKADKLKNRESAEESFKPKKEKEENDDKKPGEKGKADDIENKGNAYGKNKGEMSRRLSRQVNWAKARMRKCS